jgi:hypothetical protein
MPPCRCRGVAADREQAAELNTVSALKKLFMTQIVELREGGISERSGVVV